MPEASMNVAAPGQPHNNNLSKKKAEAKNSNTTPGPGNTPKLPNVSNQTYFYKLLEFKIWVWEAIYPIVFDSSFFIWDFSIHLTVFRIKLILVS